MTIPKKTKSFKFAEFESLSNIEQASIKGGDHTIGEILAIFNNNYSINGMQPLSQGPGGQYNVFVQLITDLNSTQIGHDMLSALVDSGHTMKLNFDPSKNGDSWNIDSNRNESLSFGFIGIPTNGFQMKSANDVNGINFLFVTHELFHAYESDVAYPNNSNLSYFGSVRRELDSELFSTMAVKEYDASHPSSNTYLNQIKTENLYTAQLGHNQDYSPWSAFSTAWSHLIDNGNFTIADYNALVVNFAKGSNYGGLPSTITNQPITSPDATTNFFINEYFPTYDRNISADDGSTSTYSNGSGSSGSGGSSSFGSNDFGYATGFNGGGSTYSYNPVDFGGSWYGYGNAPATMVGNGGQQIRVDIEPY